MIARLIDFRVRACGSLFGGHIDLIGATLRSIRGIVRTFIIERAHLLFEPSQHLADPFAELRKLGRAEEEQHDEDDDHNFGHPQAERDESEGHARQGSRLFAALLASPSMRTASRGEDAESGSHPSTSRRAVPFVGASVGLVLIALCVSGSARATPDTPYAPSGLSGISLHATAGLNPLQVASGLSSLLATSKLNSLHAIAGRGGEKPATASPEREPSEVARRKVRGGRPEGTLERTWVAPPRSADEADREALAEFELSIVVDPESSIVDHPTAPWLAELVVPDFPIRWNQATVRYLEYFRDHPRGRSMIREWMRRAGRYEARMRDIFREAGVPTDLVMVALVESGFDPHARSTAGAAGPWQFMEPTGNVYGLDRTYWVDERCDVDKSTRAAALYLKDLHARFGSWELAIAAFNAGYGLIMTTIERHNTNNYWALREIESGLPYGTTNYVPKLMAAALVSRNRAAFGVDATELESLPPADWIEVLVERSTHLTTLAKLLDTEVELLEEYNAHLIRGRTPPEHGPFPVRIPRLKAEAFDAASGGLRRSWATELTHVARHGESLAEIASERGLSETSLRRLNGIMDAAEVPGGIALVVPVESGDRPVDPAQPPLAAVPPIEPTVGQRLVFLSTTRATTLSALARAFRVGMQQIIAWNDLDPRARLQSNLILQLVVATEFDPEAHGIQVYEQDQVEYVHRGSREHIEAALRRRGLARRAYRVRSGDTLKQIGKQFELGIGDLARINGFARSHALEPKELVVVYVDDKHLRGTVDAPPPRGVEDPRSTRQAALPHDPAKAHARTSASSNTVRRASKVDSPTVRSPSRPSQTTPADVGSPNPWKSPP